jgi:hypothetical protein
LTQVRPGTDAPGLRSGALTDRQLHRLQAVQPPAPESLVPAADHGRFEPRPLVGDSPGALDPRMAETYRYSNVTRSGLREALEAAGATGGFTSRPGPDAQAASQRPKRGGFEVGGMFLAERDLRADRSETRRLDRRRFVGALAGAVAGVVLGYLSLTHLGSTLGLLILPAGLSFAVLLICVVSFGNAAFWSDMVVAKFEGRVPATPPGISPSAVPAEYEVQLWVVRAMSHDWGTWGASGRFLVAGLRDDRLGPVRSALRSAILAGGGTESGIATSGTGEGHATTGWNSPDALGQ